MINYTAFIGLGFLLLCAYAQVRPPNFSPDSIPETSFTCEDKITGGYYADVEADCQLFHVCVQVSEFEFQDFRFLCPNDTVFDQQNLVCTNWFEVDCAQSVSLFSNDFGFKDLSGGSEKSEKFDYNYNEGISYEYYEYDSSSDDDKNAGNRFLVNSSPASLKGNLGVGREHSQGFLGGKIPSHSTTAIPVGVTTTKRPPRVKSDINLRNKHPRKGGARRRPSSSRFRNPFNNPPKKAADGRRPRVKSDLRQRHHGRNNRLHSNKNKLGKKVQLSQSEFKFADPIDNELFSGPEVRPDGRPPRVKSNLNAIDTNQNFNSFVGSPSSTASPFHVIPKDSPTVEAFSPTPFKAEAEESFNTIEFSSDLFPSSTSLPFIQQQTNNRQRFSSQGRFNQQQNRFAEEERRLQTRVSTTRKSFTQPSSTTVIPLISTPSTFKVPFITRDEEITISSTAKPEDFKVPFITKGNASRKQNGFRVPFVEKSRLNPPQSSRNFKRPFAAEKKKSPTPSINLRPKQQDSSLRIPFITNQDNQASRFSSPSPISFSSSATPIRFSSTASPAFKNSFSTTKAPSNFNKNRNFNGGISTSKPFNQRFSSPRSNSVVPASTISALSQSFSSSTYSPSSTTKRSIISTTAFPSSFGSSTSKSFFNVAFTTRSPGSQPRVKSNIFKQNEFSGASLEKKIESQNPSGTFSSPNAPKFIDEIDEFEVPTTSPVPKISSTSPRPVKSRKRVTKRRKVLRKNKLGNNFNNSNRGRPTPPFKKQNTKINNRQQQKSSNTPFLNNPQNQAFAGRPRNDFNQKQFLQEEVRTRAQSNTSNKNGIRAQNVKPQQPIKNTNQKAKPNSPIWSSESASDLSNSRSKLPQQFINHQNGDSVQGSSRNINNSAHNSNSRVQSLLPEEDESFNDITAPGSIQKDKPCNDPFKCPPKKRAGGHRPRVKSNIRAKNRNFHFQHKIGRKITDSNTVRSQGRPKAFKGTQVQNQFASAGPRKPKTPPKSIKLPQNSRPVSVKQVPQSQPQKKVKPSSPPKNQIPNRPLSKNQFLSFLSSIGNASPIVTVNSKTGKLSSIPGTGFSSGFPGSNTKGVSSSSIQGFQASTPSVTFHHSSTASPSFFATSSTLSPGSPTTLSSIRSSSSSFNNIFQSSPRPSLSNFDSRTKVGRSFASPTAYFNSPLTAKPKPSPPSPFQNDHTNHNNNNNNNNRFQSVASSTEKFIASSTVRSFSTTPSLASQQVFVSSTTHSPQFSSPRPNRFRSKSRRNRPAPFTKTFASTSGSVFPSSTTPLSISSTQSPVTTSTPKNPIFLPPTPTNKILTINDIIGIVATESPKRKPRVKSNIRLAQRNSGRQSRRIAGRRADFGGLRTRAKNVKVNHSGGEKLRRVKQNELSFVSSTTPSSFHSTTKRSISPSASPSLDQKDISTTKGPLVVQSKDVSLGKRKEAPKPVIEVTLTTTAKTTPTSTTITTTTSTPPSFTEAAALRPTKEDKVKEELMELHKNMTDIDSKIEYNNKNDKEPVVRPDGQKPRVKSNLLFNSAAQQRGSQGRNNASQRKSNVFRSSFRQSRRPNRFSFNKLKSAIKPKNEPTTTAATTTTTTSTTTSSTPSSEPTTTIFYPTIRTEETVTPSEEVTEASEATESSLAPTTTKSLSTTTTASSTTTTTEQSSTTTTTTTEQSSTTTTTTTEPSSTTTTSEPSSTTTTTTTKPSKKTSSFKDRFNRYKKKPLKTSTSFLKNFLSKQRRRKGLFGKTTESSISTPTAVTTAAAASSTTEGSKDDEVKTTSIASDIV